MFIYVNVDEQGNVIKGMGGTSPVPDAEYDFFFIRDKITLDNITKFKVVLNGFKPDLVLKEGETIQDIQTSEIIDE
ncbi:hypothetical protein [Metabacillus idriensis]|uniref:hypothetical protein n=1 Tax=Metabacillus idriensis TaxID=324768 RepID=UPI00174BCE75|nr:hypothetical protein [Metabacillus idriensis]